MINTQTNQLVSNKIKSNDRKINGVSWNETLSKIDRLEQRLTTLIYKYNLATIKINYYKYFLLLLIYNNRNVCNSNESTNGIKD